jgi:hypothetical protein
MGQRFDRLCVLSHTQASDHANKGASVEKVELLAQCLAHPGARHGLQRVAGHVGELLVGEQFHEYRNRLPGANDRQFAARIGLFLAAGVGLKHRDQFIGGLSQQRSGRGLGSGVGSKGRDHETP